MTTRIETLATAVREALGEKAQSVTVALGELAVGIPVAHLDASMRLVRRSPDLRFDLLIDASGVDYSGYGGGGYGGKRFAVVYHLLSLANNWRLRVRTFAADDEFPVVPSVIDIWAGANWYERETFDLFGI